jgi:hypothetical protein
MVSGAVALLATIQSHWRHHDLKILRSIDKLFKPRLRSQLCVLVSFVSLVLSLWIQQTAAQLQVSFYDGK